MKIEAVKQSFNNLNFKGGNVQKEKSFETNTKPSGMLQTALFASGIAGLAIVAICQRNKINKILKNSNGQNPLTADRMHLQYSTAQRGMPQFSLEIFIKNSLFPS